MRILIRCRRLMVLMVVFLIVFTTVKLYLYSGKSKAYELTSTTKESILKDMQILPEEEHTNRKGLNEGYKNKNLHENNKSDNNQSTVNEKHYVVDNFDKDNHKVNEKQDNENSARDEHVHEEEETHKEETHKEETHKEENANSVELPPSSLPFIWHANFDKQYTSRGFIYESINFLVALSKSSLRVGWWPKQSFSDVQKNEFLGDFHDSDINVMYDLHHKGDEIINSGKPFILVIVEQPFEYESLSRNDALKNAAYKVGRAMFETTGIPSDWITPINNFLDELWVPSHFAKAVFTKGGIKIPIYVVPEGFDPEIFVTPLTAEQKREQRKKLFPNCREDDVIFFTVGKMEERKGIDLLEASFHDTIQDADPACLYIRTLMSPTQKNVLLKLNNEGKRVYVMDKKISMDDLITSYKAADVFVLPTHGEGWGRPIMEAMAAGLPVITTFWSGQTEYLRSDYALLINVTDLEDAYKNEWWYIGGRQYQNLHKWAKIDIKKINNHLRWCIDNREKLPLIGQKAKTAMFKNFAREKVAETIIDRIQQISNKLTNDSKNSKNLVLDT